MFLPPWNCGAAGGGPALLETLRPLSSAVKDDQNLNLITSHTVGNDIGSAADDEFASPAHAALSADARLIG
jgi:hypothetical protein